MSERPLDMPADTVGLQFEEDDFYYWNLINEQDFEPKVKTFMKSQLILDKKLRTQADLAEAYREVNQIPVGEDLNLPGKGRA